MGVTSDRVRDTAHERTPYAAEFLAPHDYQVIAQFLAQFDYFISRLSRPGMGSHHDRSLGFGPLYLSSSGTRGRTSRPGGS